MLTNIVIYDDFFQKYKNYFSFNDSCFIPQQFKWIIAVRAFKTDELYSLEI